MTLFSHGNTKLPRSTAIFNMTTARDCVSRSLNLCQLPLPSFCYAMKAERMYKNVIPYRMRQTKFWAECTAEEFVERMLKEKKRATKQLRFNESGDFISQECVKKADKVAKLLLLHGIVVYCFTARKDLRFSRVRHLVVNGSGFMVHNSFTVLPKNGTKIKNSYTCKQNCKICNVCTKKSHRFITTTMH